MLHSILKYCIVSLLFTACTTNLCEHSEKLPSAVYAYNDITNESYGSLRLYTDFSFLLIVNTRATRYEISGMFTGNQQALSLHVSELLLNEFPSEVEPFTLTAPFDGDNLVIAYPYQTMGGYLYYRDNTLTY